jgi:hypothetical protein
MDVTTNALQECSRSHSGCFLPTCRRVSRSRSTSFPRSHPVHRYATIGAFYGSATGARTSSRAPNKSSGFDCSPRRRQERKGNRLLNKTREEIEPIAEQLVDAMLKLHRALGPGLLESTYQACLAHEHLAARSRSAAKWSAWSIAYERIRPLPWRSLRLRGESLASPPFTKPSCSRTSNSRDIDLAFS